MAKRAFSPILQFIRRVHRDPQRKDSADQELLRRFLGAGGRSGVRGAAGETRPDDARRLPQRAGARGSTSIGGLAGGDRGGGPPPTAARSYNQGRDGCSARRYGGLSRVA